MKAYFTVDVEQDCPPFLDTWRGMEEGFARMMALLDELEVKATFFTTGEVARRYPSAIRRIVSDGHELGCHGDTHRSFADLAADEAEREIARASDSLRAFAPVTSFRAPFLTFPDRYLDLLARQGYRLDSSQGRHKHLSARVHVDRGLLRVPASVTSSTLRWPALPRDLLFARLTPPAVLFVHPWEFVDFTRSSLRWDCRFRTGDAALDDMRECLTFFQSRGAQFGTMRECALA